MSSKSTSLLVLALAAVNVAGQSLSVVNSCDFEVALFTQTSEGTVYDAFLTVAAGATQNMGISTNWAGAINVGTGCNSAYNCATGGPVWNGVTPFSRAEFNFFANPGQVVYDISQIYGYNVGMEISTGVPTCQAFACTISSGCPASGPSNPDGSSTCFSPCCASATDCSGGAIPGSGGGCAANTRPGPGAQFYFNACPNAYSTPAASGCPAADFTASCANTNVTLTLCPGTTTRLYSRR